MCVVHITLGVPRRTDFSKKWSPGICRFSQRVATWQWVRPSLPDSLCLQRGKQPTKNMGIITKMQKGKG